MQIVLDAALMAEKEAAHEYLMRELALPEYYGRNLDALYDCLTEQDDLEIIFINVPDAQTPSYFHTLSRVFADAALNNPGLWIRTRE